MTATASLGLDAPEFARLTPVASGLVAAPVSNARGEYLIWFRPEQVRTVTWGGDPFKPALLGDDPGRPVAAALLRAMAPGRRGHRRAAGPPPS